MKKFRIEITSDEMFTFLSLFNADDFEIATYNFPHTIPDDQKCQFLSVFLHQMFLGE